MCQETLSQNTRVCRAVQARHVTTGVIFFGWPSVGSETEWHSTSPPQQAAGATGETSPAHGNQRSRGGEGGLCRC